MRVEKCISAIRRWMELDELKLNRDKTEVTLSHSRYSASPFFQFFCVGSLGVIFDKHMSFHARVKHL